MGMGGVRIQSTGRWRLLAGEVADRRRAANPAGEGAGAAA